MIRHSHFVESARRTPVVSHDRTGSVPTLARLFAATIAVALATVFTAAAPQDPKPTPKPDEPKKPAAKPAGADAELDKLLERIGESAPDRPKTKAEPKRPGPAQKPRPEDPNAAKLEDQDKGLDEHLEELLGRRRRRNQQDQEQQGGQGGQGGESRPSPADDENSPLAKTIRKMRSVEKRLGQRDTGEETRGEQEQIIKDFDQLIAQARRAAQQGQQRRMQQQQGQERPGEQPGNEQNQPGATAQGVGAGKPKTPTNIRALVGDKDIWGNLPPALREEMENVFREEALPASVERVSRYYEAILRKSTPGAPASRPTQ